MLEKMMSQYSDMAELQQFAEAQHTTIVKQAKKLQEMEQEIAHLKSLLITAAPILHVEGILNINDEESIARSQLNKLREISFARELTLEEARKLDIYAKIINQIENRPKKTIDPAKTVSTEELVKQLSEGK